MWLGNLRAARIKPDHTGTCVFYQFDIVSDDYYSLTRFPVRKKLMINIERLTFPHHLPLLLQLLRCIYVSAAPRLLHSSSASSLGALFAITLSQASCAPAALHLSSQSLIH